MNGTDIAIVVGFTFAGLGMLAGILIVCQNENRRRLKSLECQRARETIRRMARPDWRERDDVPQLDRRREIEGMIERATIS
jgi:hypothetical protein